MRLVNGIMCVVLGLFAFAQYNDPDALLWVLIYGIPAAWAGLIAFRPQLLPANRRRSRRISGVPWPGVAGTMYPWPSLPELDRR